MSNSYENSKLSSEVGEIAFCPMLVKNRLAMMLQTFLTNQNRLDNFTAPETTKPKQKLMSQFQIEISLERIVVEQRNVSSLCLLAVMSDRYCHNFYQ